MHDLEVHRVLERDMSILLRGVMIQWENMWIVKLNLDYLSMQIEIK